MNDQFDELTGSESLSATDSGLKQLGLGLLMANLALVGISPSVAATATFRSTGAMHNARDGHTATLLLNGKVLVAGGGVITTNELSSAELYDPATGSWSRTTPMHAVRWGHTATLLTNGLVLVAGGQEDTDVPSAELFDPANENWTGTVPMTRRRFFHTATLLRNGRVLLAGGDSTGSSAELFDPVTRNWIPTGPMTELRFWHTATLLPDGRVLVAGGNDYSGDFYDVRYTAELYDPASNTWTATGEMNDERAQHTATLLTNGLVLVAGGWKAGAFGQSALPQAELYDPATETWTSTGSMVSSSPAVGRIGRFAHTATLLASGEVLITGGEFRAGFAPPGSLYFAELYDPAQGAWKTTERMIANREHHSATRLPNGDVLVAGGYFMDQNRDLGSAEVYRPDGTVPVALPTRLANLRILADGSFRFSFTNTAGAAFRVFATANLALPANNWTLLGRATEVSPGQFEFTDTQTTNQARQFYRTVSP